MAAIPLLYSTIWLSFHHPAVLQVSNFRLRYSICPTCSDWIFATSFSTAIEVMEVGSSG